MGTYRQNPNTTTGSEQIILLNAHKSLWKLPSFSRSLSIFTYHTISDIHSEDFFFLFLKNVDGSPMEPLLFTSSPINYQRKMANPAFFSSKNSFPWTQKTLKTQGSNLLQNEIEICFQKVENFKKHTAFTF